MSLPTSFEGILAAVSTFELEIGLAGAYLLRKCNFYKHWKELLIGIAGGLLAYRAIALNSSSSSNGQHMTLLDIMVQRFLSVSKFYSLNFLLGDVGGIILCASAFKGIDAMNFDRQLLLDQFFSMLKRIPFVKQKLDHEKLKFEKDFVLSLKGKARSISYAMTALPEQGHSHESLLQLMKTETCKEDTSWQQGKVSGAVYFGDEAHHRLLNEAFAMYSIANPLHADLWPSVMKFEAEIVSMTASLVRGDNHEVCGCTTSGGTESIILAIKAHRDYYRDTCHIFNPELICSQSAHAAVDKACDILGIRLIKIPMIKATARSKTGSSSRSSSNSTAKNVSSSSYELDMAALQRAISPNTILLYASAPSFPHGAIDPIESMAALARQYNIGLHVDCCLGGFVLPFARKLGYDIPKFDFSVSGVTSMSLDTHKYGFALKGSSVVLYATRELRQAQYFCYPEWTGGLYTTPTLAGSRSGGLIAQCWASLMALGTEGYMSRVKNIMECARSVSAGINRIPGLKLLGRGQTMIVCFTTDRDSLSATDRNKPFNIYAINDRLTHHHHYALNALQHPPCLHLCVTYKHLHTEEKFIEDVREAVDYVLQHPEVNASGNAAVYGMTSSLPPGPVKEILKVYNDVVLNL